MILESELISHNRILVKETNRKIIESKEQIAITKLLVKELKQEINLIKKTVDKLKLTLN